MRDNFGLADGRPDPALIEAIERHFERRNGGAWTKLGDVELSYYRNRGFSGGWRLPILFSDEVVRHVDVLISRFYPVGHVRTALVEHPENLTWPHVEYDGVLCLLPNSSETDSNDPVMVIDNLVTRSCRLIEDLLEGSIIQRDFKDEFLTYWNSYSLFMDRPHYTLLRPEGPSRQVSVFHGRYFSVVAEDDETLRKWVENRFGTGCKSKLQPAALLWLDEPLLPRQYPLHGRDVAELAAGSGAAATAALESTVRSHPSEITVLIGAEGGKGAGFVAVTVPRPMDSSAMRRTVAINKGGFRGKSVPLPLLMQRYFGATPVARSKVTRVDAAWIHGRDRDPRVEILRRSNVVVFGCGSVGSSVASGLVKAGVGTLRLVDYDDLDSPNVGRHHLGIASLRQNKASELARRLREDYPHATVDGHDNAVAGLVLARPDWMEKADLIISATGSGAADQRLNRWHGKIGRRMPLLYGWTEPYAGAAHALAIAGDGGCLLGGVDNLGIAKFEMTEWRTNAYEEPACGIDFTPYGPTELGNAHSLILELALDCLLGKVTASTHRIWAARSSHLAEFDGRWTPEGEVLLGDRIEGGLRLERTWPQCECCSGDRATEMAVRLSA